MMTLTSGEGAEVQPRAWHCAIEPVRHVLADGRSVVLRLLAPSDEDLMAEFFASLTAREIYYFFPLDDADARRLACDAATDAAWRLIAVGELAGQERILGYMFLDWARECPPTFGACLRGDAQSSGLGRALIGLLLASAAASGVERVQLTVHADNWRALRLYQRVGFRLMGEFILQHQGAKQYRMEADLQRPCPALLDDLTIAARGGLGVGMAARRIQDAIEALVGRRPLIMDRPTDAEAYALIVTDLAAPMERPFETPLPLGQRGDGPAWIVTLDDHYLLIGGVGATAVDRAARLYCDAIAAHDAGDRATGATGGLGPPPDWLPFTGLSRSC